MSSRFIRNRRFASASSQPNQRATSLSVSVEITVDLLHHDHQKPLPPALLKKRVLSMRQTAIHMGPSEPGIRGMSRQTVNCQTFHPTHGLSTASRNDLMQTGTIWCCRHPYLQMRSYGMKTVCSFCVYYSAFSINKTPSTIVQNCATWQHRRFSESQTVQAFHRIDRDA